MILALAAAQDWEVEQMDVKTAFLYGMVEEDIYVEQVKGFEDGLGSVTTAGACSEKVLSSSSGCKDVASSSEYKLSRLKKNGSDMGWPLKSPSGYGM